MQIESLVFKNIGRYGNKPQEIKFSKEGSLNMIVGKNGSGKCVYEHTEIEIEFEDLALEEKFKEYLKKKM